MVGSTVTRGPISCPITGLEDELQEFAGSAIVRAILEQRGENKSEVRKYTKVRRDGILVAFPWRMHERAGIRYPQDIESRLREVEMDSVQDYVAETENLLELQRQIRMCDGVLSELEGLLGKFEVDLGKTTKEIKELQEQSVNMSDKASREARLTDRPTDRPRHRGRDRLPWELPLPRAAQVRNRRQAEDRLARFINNVTPNPSLVRAIFEGEVDESYADWLTQLGRKLDFCQKDPLAKDAAGTTGMQSLGSPALPLSDFLPPPGCSSTRCPARAGSVPHQGHMEGPRFPHGPHVPAAPAKDQHPGKRSRAAAGPALHCKCARARA